MFCQHELKIINFKSGEVVTYPIVIIRGCIQSSGSCKVETIHISTNTTTFSSKIVNKKFQALLELNFGQNLIKFNYCSTTLNLTLNYNPRTTKFSVQPLYIICDGHDGTFQAPKTETNSVESALRRITLASKLLQSVIAEKLFEGKQGRKTYHLEGGCRIFHSRLNYLEARKMGQNEIWSRIAEEIVDSDLEDQRIKFLGFLSCTKYCGENYHENLTHDDVIKMTEAHVALGGGGLGLYSTACLYTWPENLSEVVKRFRNFTPIDKRNFMDDSNYRGTLGACFSTTLGAALHELCHTLDLGHTRKGIMARGFDDIDKIFVLKADSEDISDQKENLRLEKLVERRKEFFIDEDVAENGAFWTKSCVMILAYHRWLNNFAPSENTIKYNPTTNVVNSRTGLRVIELRNTQDFMVLSNWTFDSRILKYSFQLPEIPTNLELFVEDNIGNIFKQSVP